MPKTIQASISGGEASPRMAERFDLPQYGAIVKTALNRIVTLEGSNVRAPGTVHIDGVPDPDRQHRLVSFKRSEAQSFILEFGNHTLRIFDANTGEPVLVDGVGEFILVTPYGSDDLDFLYWWQSVSVMWLTHKSNKFEPHVLTRFEDETWGLKPFSVQLGPFRDLNFNEELRIRADRLANEPGDVITLTASDDVFEPDHAGGLLRLFLDNYGFPYEAWAAEADARQGDYIQHDGRVYQIQIDNGDNEPFNRSPPVHEQGSVAQGQRDGTNDVLIFNYQHDGAGTVRIISIDGPRSATAVLEPTVGNMLPERLTLDDGTNGWQFGAYSERYGFPAIGTIFQQRLTFMGTRDAPDTFDMSRPEAFNPDNADFQPNRGNGEVDDSHAVRRTLADGELNAPAWLIANDRLYVGSERGVTAISGPSIDEPISPNGASARPLLGVPGSSYRCLAIYVETAIVYASKDGAKLYALYPDYSYRELLKFARHTGDSPIVELAWLPAPLNLIAVRRQDGRLYLVTFEQQDQIVAPVQYVPGGTYERGPAFVEAIATAPDENRVDRLWMIVRRTVEGAIRRDIERMHTDWNPRTQFPDEAVYVSAATLFDHWHKDGVSILVQPDDDGQRDDMAHVTADGPAFAGWSEGDILHVRFDHVPRRDGDVAGIFKLQVVDVPSDQNLRVRMLNDLPEAFHDNGEIDWGRGVSTLTGLEHLEGQQVYVNGDGQWLFNDGADDPDSHLFTVSGGVIDLGRSVVRAVCGLPHKGITRSTRLVGTNNRGPSLFEDINSKQVYSNLSYGAIDELFVRSVVNGYLHEKDPLVVRNTEDLQDQSGGQFPELGPLTYRQTIEADRGCNVEFLIEQDGVLPSEINAIGADWERT